MSTLAAAPPAPPDEAGGRGGGGGEKRGGIGSVVVALFPPADRPCVPAVPENDFENVFALPEKRGDVVRLVLDPAAIVGPAWSEYSLSHASPVEVRLVETEGGGVEPCASD